MNISYLEYLSKCHESMFVEKSFIIITSILLILVKINALFKYIYIVLISQLSSIYPCFSYPIIF